MPDEVKHRRWIDLVPLWNVILVVFALGAGWAGLQQVRADAADIKETLRQVSAELAAQRITGEGMRSRLDEHERRIQEVTAELRAFRAQQHDWNGTMHGSLREIRGRLDAARKDSP